MSQEMLLILILVIGTSTGYDFKCPANAEWKLNAKVRCSLEEKYVCLFNVLEKKYQDNCLWADRSSIGSKLVFQPLFNLEECNADTFQPIVFTTHGNSDCILLKSKCDEEGQVVYSNGSSSNDTVCRCDYTKGFTFVSNPKNSCFCKPSEEDCSCYRVKCAKLSPDYQCLANEQERTKTTCQEIYPQISNNRHNRTVQYILSSKKRFSNAYQVTYFIIAAMGLYIVMVVLKVYVCDQFKYRRSRKKRTPICRAYNEVPQASAKNSKPAQQHLDVTARIQTTIPSCTSGTSVKIVTSDASTTTPSVKFSVATESSTSGNPSVPPIMSSTIQPSLETIYQRCAPGAPTKLTQETIESDSGQKCVSRSYLPLKSEHDEATNMDNVSRCKEIRTATFEKTSEYDSATYKMMAGNTTGTRESGSLQFKDKKEYDDERHKIIDEIFRNGECGKHYFARVVLIGQNGVGKTSLMRRLLWQNKKDVTDLQSTDGIEIKKCNINVTNGNWSPYEKKDDDLSRLIHQLYRERKLTEEKGQGQNHGKYDFVQGHRSNNTDSKIVEDGNVIQKETTTYKNLLKQSGKTSHDAERSINKNNKEIPKTDGILPIGNRKSKGHTIRYEQKDNIEYSTDYKIKSKESGNESGIDEKTDNIISAIIETHLHSGDEEQQDMMAFCWLWDFAGKEDFFATHQVFMSKSAVYILVTDRLNLSTIENNCDDSAYWIRLWFDAIHCHMLASNKDHLDPPIIVVCTNEDKLKKPLERQKRQEKFIDNLSRVLNKEMKRHLRNIYFVSNTEDDDTVFEEIREDVSRQAMNMKDWGRPCPLRWPLFHQVVRKLKESNASICTTTKLKEIAKNTNIGINSDEEFKLCLQYFHEIGTIIYFEDAVLKEYVILDPKWLVNAFRCLVSDKIGNVIKVSDDWRKLKETGELTDVLVSSLFRKDPKLNFLENKNHLLEVMKRFDIVMNLKNSNMLYMPCMMECRSFAKVQKLFTGSSQPLIRTSWFCLEFDFLPPSFFNHILAEYTKLYQVSTIFDEITRNKRYALFRQVGVFDMDLCGYEKLVICESPNIIALQVWNSNHTNAWLRRKLIQFIDSLCHRYGLHILFSKALKCKDGDFTDNRNKLSSLLDKYYWCVEHNKKHLSNDLIKSWDFGTELLELKKERCGEKEETIMLDVSAQLCPIAEIIHEVYTKLKRSKEAYILLILRTNVYSYIMEYNPEQITIFVNNKKVVRIYDVPYSDKHMAKTKLIFHIKGNTLKIRNTDTDAEKEIVFDKTSM